MIQLSSISKRFLGQVLFEDLTWQINPADRFGLIGANGSGKTTLLRLLSRQLEPDTGIIAIARGVTVGYLPQEGVEISGRTLFEETLSVFDELLKMEREQHRIAEQLQHLERDSSAAREALDRLGQLQTAFQIGGGFSLESKVGHVLAGLGFDKRDWTKPVDSFSGGWQMRIALAKLLLQQPNLLLLDEPTNHLDLEARNWLEGYLQTYPHACIIVSHDRFFLDATVDRIADLFGRKLTIYTGSYTRYLAQREANLTALLERQRRQQEHIEKLENFINKFRYKASKAKQVQSRIKELEKIERIELPEVRKTIHFSFPQPQPSGRRVMELTGLSKRYESLEVFRDVDLLVERGEKIVLIGPNGAGKSTLMRILADREPFQHGSRTLGHNVQLDYFAQDQDRVLDKAPTVLDTLMAVAPMDMVPQLRTLLGSFLFRGDEVFKPVEVLSGGERNRLALARMLLQPANFLILDEPTNHLDMEAKEVLLAALQRFTGTVVFVSHDRYFIDKLAGKVIEVGGGEIHVYLGNYEDYLWIKQQEDPDAVQGILIAQDLRSDSKPSPPPATRSAAAVSRAKNTEFQPKSPTGGAKRGRVNPQKVAQLDNRIAESEKIITALEDRISGLEKQLANREFFSDPTQANACLAEWEQAREALQERMAEWEHLTLERDQADDTAHPARRGVRQAKS